MSDGRLTRRVMEAVLECAVYMLARDKDGELGRVALEFGEDGLPAPHKYRIDCQRNTGQIAFGLASVEGHFLVYWFMPPAQRDEIIELTYNGIQHREDPFHIDGTP